ncbi:MAG: bifunctional homocysteine S-methyltransferase/methylenetetrahydrofolate reductase [Bacteroidetes bacterium]|nr:bifunctional homocysteine S-methyltransferase/methylenetetrahydrofolate reductase [Bacteroidota bacterium]
MNSRFLERLQQRPIVIDGSIEAVLRSRGYDESPVELYNLKNPLLVEQIHGEFIDAGAEIIQANTRRANAITLDAFKLKDKVYEINRKGVWLARTASLNRAFVAGVVGPIGKFLAPIGKLQPEEVREAFMTQIHALVDGNCDLLLLKSFIDVDELEIALHAARHISSDIPIIAQKTFPEDAAVLATEFPREVAKRLHREGVVAIGSNGTVGPNRMLGIVRSLHGATGAILSAQPDIGIPTLVDGHPVYNATLEYVANSARVLVENGVTIIGMDGGAMPEHVRAISVAIAETPVGIPVLKAKKQRDAALDQPQPESQPSTFQRNLGRKFLVTVELDIPRGLDMSEVYEGAEYLGRHGIDAVNISDGARARLRMNSITISHLIRERTGMECITHMACRDRNMVGLQSELLGAHVLGVRNILAVTGDPAHIGDYPYATSVYDVDAIGLIRALHRMNEGSDLMGNPVGERTNFLIACACNPVADDLDREIGRLERKVAEGANVAFTQPVFEAAALATFLERTAHLAIPIMLGIIPLRSALHAEFLHHEVPGMKIPEHIQQRMRAAHDSLAEGIAVAVEFLESIQAMRDRIAGIYVMPPRKKNEMIVEILERAGLRSGVNA